MLMRNTSRDYSFFAKRLCARRILCFLKRHHLEFAAHQLDRETTVYFDLSHLKFLATSARWDELTSYVAWFLPSDPESSPQANNFWHCLHIYRVLAMIAAGGKQAQHVDTLFPLLDAAATKADPQTAELRTFFHEVRRRPPRDYGSWAQIWEAAGERLKKLAVKCPELKGKLHLPHYAPKHWQINLCGAADAKDLQEENQPTKSVCSFLRAKEEINASLSGFSSNGTSDSMTSNMEIEPAALQNPLNEALATVPGSDAGTSYAAGILGGDGSKAEDASNSLKRKMDAMADTDADASTRLLKARNESSSPLYRSASAALR
ncbi:hypothetical protein ACP70R_016813 [Stipagrostis hirtigluma subsp. patula]